MRHQCQYKAALAASAPRSGDSGPDQLYMCLIAHGNKTIKVFILRPFVIKKLILFLNKVYYKDDKIMRRELKKKVNDWK